MADPVVFEFLHAEIVKYVMNEKPGKEVLDYMGFSCGYRIIERYLAKKFCLSLQGQKQKIKLTREWPKFKDELEIVKFICTDFWTATYGKQIDNLRTNNQGLYVLQDNTFRFLNKMSIGKQYLDIAPNFLAYTCGLIRGSLANLGVTCVVNVEVQNMPSAKFHIQVQRS